MVGICATETFDSDVKNSWTRLSNVGSVYRSFPFKIQLALRRRQFPSARSKNNKALHLFYNEQHKPSSDTISHPDTSRDEAPRPAIILSYPTSPPLGTAENVKIIDGRLRQTRPYPPSPKLDPFTCKHVSCKKACMWPGIHRLLTRTHAAAHPDV